MWFHDTNSQLRVVRHELNELMKEKTKGAMLRAKIDWTFLGERPTKYYLNLEKKKFVNKTLYRVKNPKGEIVDQPDSVLNEIKEFYKNLYTSKGRIDTGYINKIEVPSISEEMKAQLDAPITADEISQALKSMQGQKSPGTDGLPAEFYKVFWHKLKPFFVNLLNEIADTESFHLSVRRGILSLLEKVGKDMMYLDCWRPLTLLNLDNKLYTKVLANRLEHCTSELIHFTQTGFMKGRMLSENILKILEIMHTCEKKNLNALLISFDFHKAFDSIEWEAIFMTLRKFGFGNRFVDMIKVVYHNPLVCASNNGYWSQFITPSHATRQGCCLSPTIFNLVVELLGAGIRQNSDIKGITINNQNIKAGQYADDLWTVLQAEVDSVDATLREIEALGDFSGLTLNFNKCAVLKLGPWKDTDAKFYTLKKLFWSPKEIRILGIDVFVDWERMAQANYDKLLFKVKDIFNSWTHQNLTFIGKITIINSLVSSLFINKFLALPSPSRHFFRVYKNMLTEFLWNNRVPKISYKKIVQRYERLGLKLVDLESKDIALKASWPIRWKERNFEEIRWFFQNFPVRDKRIWECNIEYKDIQKLDKTPFCVSMSIWEAWSKINYIPVVENSDEIYQMQIWGNSLVRRKNFPIFDTSLVNSNIVYILDIYNIETKGFFSYEKLVEVFGVVLDEITYYGVLAAIPRMWKQKLKHSSLDKPLDMESMVEQKAKGNFPTRNMYWELVNRKFPPKLTCKFLWERELNCEISEDT